MLLLWDIPTGLFLGNSYNGFNNLARLAILWNVRRRCPGVVRFVFDCYRNSTQLLV